MIHFFFIHDHHFRISKIAPGTDEERPHPLTPFFSVICNARKPQLLIHNLSITIYYCFTLLFAMLFCQIFFFSLSHSPLNFLEFFFFIIFQLKFLNLYSSFLNYFLIFIYEVLKFVIYVALHKIVSKYMYTYRHAFYNLLPNIQFLFLNFSLNYSYYEYFH